MNRDTYAMRHRIIARAMCWAYMNARALGMTADEAADEAMVVADFIKRSMV